MYMRHGKTAAYIRAHSGPCCWYVPRTPVVRLCWPDGNTVTCKVVADSRLRSGGGV